MKKNFSSSIAIIILIVIGAIILFPVKTVWAKEQTQILSGKAYDLDEKDAYVFTPEKSLDSPVGRLEIEGNFSKADSQNGFTCFAVDLDDNDDVSGKDDNLTITLNLRSKAPTYVEDIKDIDSWHIVEDNTKKVNGTTLKEKIKTGAILVQTSKDGKIWVNAEEKTDIFNDTFESEEPLYRTTNVQLSNGCYYRIIVAYKMRVKVGTTLLGKVVDYDYKERAEVYEFYAYNKNVDDSHKLNITEAYELGETYRTAEFEGYVGKQEIDNEDPHNGWDLGHFYVDGYTAKTEDINGDVIFLKEVGDRATLWFNLEQDLESCNGNSAIKVTADNAGSDQYFRTPIFDFGKGTLIIRKIDSLNKKETQYYTNFLEASAVAGANTRVDIFEEGDYEVALDYQLEYDKSKIPGKKTLHYRMYFNFKVRNGDCKLFIRDAGNNSFLNNASVAKNGFYIDLAQSKYLNLIVTRHVMTDSMDGLVPDTKFNGAAKEGRIYDEEGIYTIRAINKYTEVDPTEKRVYVGDSSVLKAYIKYYPELTVSEINEKIAAGFVIDDDGNIIDGVSLERKDNKTIKDEVDKEVKDSTVEQMVVKDVIKEEPIISETEEEFEKELGENNEKPSENINPKGLIAVVLLVGAFVSLIYKKRKNLKECPENVNVDEKEDDAE